MSDTVIHNINISYDESHEEVRDFVNYLKSDKRKDEVKAYYEEARHSPGNKIHLSDKFDNEFTLICEHEHVCYLRLRGM
ncbi:MAG: hypothetical protein WCO07_03275 [bacterium]